MIRICNYGYAVALHPSATCAVSVLVYPKKHSSTSTQTASSPDDDYQFLQQSELPTLHFQKSLPRLPIPLLEKTCQRYLSAVQPIVSSEQFEETQKSVKDFREGVGMELQALLKKSDASNKHTSYISEPWFDMYLRDRQPLPLNYNPLLVMKPDPRPSYQSQMLRATNLVISSLRFWRSLQEGLLAPEVFHMNPVKSDTAEFRRWTRLTPSPFATYVAYAFKAFPLDMSQYERLFGVSRIPDVGKDRLVQNKNAKHIVVMRGGSFYAVNVLNNRGEIEPPSVILGRLLTVVQMEEARAEINKLPLGVLTTQNRDKWAETRKHFVHNTTSLNKDLLEQEVDAALFCLCLDSDEDAVYNERNPVPIFKHLLAGDGKNRWFDKSVSLIVSADGTAAINFEHSWGDGVAVLRYFNEIYKDSIEKSFVHPNTTPHISKDDSVRLINFQIVDTVEDAIKQAILVNNATINNLDMCMTRFNGINKDVCKRNRISPDSIMQLAFQLAYRQCFGLYVGTYESCSTAAFRHGRTETMRPCTMATKNFCQKIISITDKSKLNLTELREMINQCSIVHGQLTRDAAMGQGFDRHLFALKNMALKNGIEVPVIYNDKSYNMLNHNIISTSTLSSDALLAGAFGPVVPDGLGIGYSIQNDECGAIVTSYKSSDKGNIFIESLNKALRDLEFVIKNK